MNQRIEPLEYYSLERYLFTEVHQRFRANKSLDAFDFFSIIIWKANRAKSKVALRLLSQPKLRNSDLDTACRAFTSQLCQAQDDEERLLIAMKEWGFLLPMATAILSVLWPDSFTVYDVRVCDELSRQSPYPQFHRLAYKASHLVWPGYCLYRDAVKAAASDASPNEEELSLRDMDRILWARSSIRQLKDDILNHFSR